MKSYLMRNFLTLLAVFLIFLSFFQIMYLTPMQCDDFWYYDIGLSLDRHIKHYLHWSGRIVADYFSCALLQIPSHAVRSAILASFATGICYVIVKIPTAVNSDYKVSWWKLFVVAALYWIANPQIEDSTFWVVGACNYVVTTFFVLLFLYFVLKNRESFVWWMAILSVVAGCSNENTCLAVIYVLFVLICISYFKKLNSLILDIRLSKKIFLIYMALFVIGALILMLAPGNFERLHAGVCQDWCNLSLSEKIKKFTDRSRWGLQDMQNAYWFYLFMLIIAGISFKKNRKAISWSLLFFSVSIVSHVVMIASPYFPGRSLFPSLCFLLLAASFLLDRSVIRYRVLKIILAGVIVCVLWLFIKFFMIIHVGHKAIMIQDAIRIDHIKYVRERKGRHITVDIPQHYVNSDLRRYNVSFAFEFIPYGMEATWNGVDELNHIRVDFDYSILRTAKTIPVINKTGLSDVKVYFQPKSALVRQATFMLESSDPIDKNLIMRCLDDQKRIIFETQLNNQTIELQGKYYGGISIENYSKPHEVLLIESSSDQK